MTNNILLTNLCAYGLFNNATSISDHITLNGGIISEKNEMKFSSEGSSIGPINVLYYPGICVDELWSSGQSS
jgi:hypothetical protein